MAQLAPLDLSEARAKGRDSGPVLQVRYAQPVTPALAGPPPAGRRPFSFTTHYNPPCLVRLMRGVLENLALTWRQVQAEAGPEPQFVNLRRVGEGGQVVATLVIISDHDPLTVERVQEAIQATRFGGPNGWKANPNHFTTKKGEA